MSQFLDTLAKVHIGKIVLLFLCATLFLITSVVFEGPAIKNALKTQSALTIELNGSPLTVLFDGDKYEELGARAYEGELDLTDLIEIEGTVDHTTPDDYSITYSVIHPDYGTSSVERTVRVYGSTTGSGYSSGTPPPQLLTVAPNSIEGQGSVTVYGYYLDTINKLYLMEDYNNYDTAITPAYNIKYDTEIEFFIPSDVPDGTYSIRVYSNSGHSLLPDALTITNVPQTFYEAPIIAFFDPPSAKIGDTVKVLGQNFGAGAYIQVVDGGGSISVVHVSPNELRFVVPTHLRLGINPLRVGLKASGTVSNVVDFIVKEEYTTTEPSLGSTTLSAVDPVSTYRGGKVLVYGTGLADIFRVYLLKDSTDLESAVRPPFSVVSSTTVSVQIPTTIPYGVYSVRVASPSGVDILSNALSILEATPQSEPPTVLYIEPSSARIGDTVTVYGNNIPVASYIDVVDEGWTLQSEYISSTRLRFKVTSGFSYGTHRLRVVEKLTIEDHSSNVFDLTVLQSNSGPGSIDSTVEPTKETTTTADKEVAIGSTTENALSTNVEPIVEEENVALKGSDFTQETVKDASDDTTDSLNGVEQEQENLDSEPIFEKQPIREYVESEPRVFRVAEDEQETTAVAPVEPKPISSMIVVREKEDIRIEYEIENEDEEKLIFELVEEVAKEERLFEKRKERNLNKDSDNDGIIDYDEVVLYGTNPFKAKTREGELTDGEKILKGLDPRSSTTKAILFESPKVANKAVVVEEFKVERLEVTERKLSPILQEERVAKIELSGSALPDSFVTLYIYSTPIVVTVKTDSEGRWSYELDRELEDGAHEVYVATVDNSGKIIARSNPIPFVKEANAASLGATIVTAEENTNFFRANLAYIFFFASLIGVLIMIFFVGSDYVKIRKENENVIHEHTG